MEDKQLVPLTEKEWKSFNPVQFFTECQPKQKLTKADVTQNARYPVYSSQTTNGGIMGFVDKPDFLVSNDDAFFVVFSTHGRVFHIARYSFAASNNTKILRPKPGLSWIAMLFLLTAWQNVIPDLGYATHWKAARRCLVKLPVDDDGEPDWNYMEQYIKARM